MFENFLVWYKNDPTAKNKIAFFIGICVFFPVLFISIWWLNSPKNTNFKTESSNSIKKPQITQANFENSPQLEIIDTEPLGNLSQIYFQKSQIFSFSQNGNLKVDGQNLPSSPSFLPLSFYNSDGFLIINEQKQSTIFENKAGIFKQVEVGISQILPFENQFYYLFGRGNNLTISRADNISLSQNIITLTSFSLPDVNSWAEMRLINKEIFIFIYSDSSRQGEVFVQKLEQKNISQNISQNSLKLIQTWKNVQSLLFGENSVILTQNNTNEPYTSKIINFGNFGEFLINNKKVQELGIKGQVWAERCSFENSKNQIENPKLNSVFCLVKNEDVFVFNSMESDKIIKIDITNNKFEKVLDTLIFSASYIYSNDGQIYIINPLKDLLYRFKV